MFTPDEGLTPPVDRPLVRYPIKTARALIDAEDLRRVQAHTWMIDPDGYARSRTAGALHRYVMGAGPNDPPVDHINRVKLDCRKCNLRMLSISLNNLNTQVAVDGGVRNANGKYVARVTYLGEYIHIGSFDTEAAAKQARDDAVKRIIDGETTITIYRRGIALDKEIVNAQQDRNPRPSDRD